MSKSKYRSPIEIQNDCETFKCDATVTIKDGKATVYLNTFLDRMPGDEIELLNEDPKLRVVTISNEYPGIVNGHVII